MTRRNRLSYPALSNLSTFTCWSGGTCIHSEIVIQKSLHDRHSLRIVELLPSMAAPVNNVELHWQFGFLIAAHQFVRLVDRNLRILIAVNYKQRRVGRI